MWHSLGWVCYVIKLHIIGDMWYVTKRGQTVLSSYIWDVTCDMWPSLGSVCYQATCEMRHVIYETALAAWVIKLHVRCDMWYVTQPRKSVLSSYMWNVISDTALAECVIKLHVRCNMWYVTQPGKSVLSIYMWDVTCDMWHSIGWVFYQATISDLWHVICSPAWAKSYQARCDLWHVICDTVWSDNVIKLHVTCYMWNLT